jgi:hypothetical protein
MVRVDLHELRSRALAFARRMYADDDPRQVKCADRFVHEEYIKMTAPPIRSPLERIEVLLAEVRDILKSQKH